MVLLPVRFKRPPEALVKPMVVAVALVKIPMAGVVTPRVVLLIVPPLSVTLVMLAEFAPILLMNALALTIICTVETWPFTSIPCDLNSVANSLVAVALVAVVLPK